MAAVSKPGKGNRIFISTVSGEFEKADAAFPGLRSKLRHHLMAADCEVKVQEDFRQTTGGTLEKLDDYIRHCDAVIHLVGEMPGHLADADSPQDVPDFLAHIAAEPGGRGFLDRQPELRSAFGEGAGISLTQFEAYMALHHEVPLFVYATAAAAKGQEAHLKRLLQARPKKHASPFTDAADLLGQLIGDLRYIIPALGKGKPLLAPTRLVSRHRADELLGREEELALLDAAWNPPATENQEPRTTNMLSIIAWGGVGKTALLAYWVQTRFIEKGWPGVEAYFDWTFYDQGTRRADATHAGAASVGSFFQTALRHFGDPDPENPQGKVTRLAHLIQARRSLLVLDGLEPLQYPLNHAQAGQITDPDLRELLGLLAQQNPGLCLISSRQVLTDFLGLRRSVAPSHDLGELPEAIAVRLLQQMQVLGSDEDLAKAARDYFGHALSLIVLGRFIVSLGGDIRRRDTIPLERACESRDEQITRNAWHVLEAYDQWLGSAAGQSPALRQALRLTGLFDRPASPDCLSALRQAPAIPGLTDQLVGLSPDAWNKTLRTLDAAHLIQLRFPATEPGSQAPRPEAREVAIDVHPLIREYFAKQLREKEAAGFQEAHARLFDHLCARAEHQPDTLEGLAPLYQAVVHGCLAGRQQEACDKVYRDRILRGRAAYSTKQLGAIGSDLGAVAAFFEEPWSRLSANLSADWQAWLLNEAAFSLRALGRLTEAVEPMRVSIRMAAEQEDWKNAAIYSSNLSELEVTLGRVEEAVAEARRSIEFADRSGDAFLRMARRTTAADALHQRGEREEARRLFQQAEAMQREDDPQFDLLYSLAGFRYCDLILAPAERAAWRVLTGFSPPELGKPQGSESSENPGAGGLKPETTLWHEALAEAERRANAIFSWRRGTIWNPNADSLLSIALDHLTLARTSLYRALLFPNQESAIQNQEFQAALDGLRKAGMMDDLPRALLTAALHHHLHGAPDAARRALDEAQQIAERGPMPLYLADVHLHRARLAGMTKAEGRRTNWPGIDPKAELAKARALIENHRYGRRKEELEDAEAASATW